LEMSLLDKEESTFFAFSVLLAIHFIQSLSILVDVLFLEGGMISILV